MDSNVINNDLLIQLKKFAPDKEEMMKIKGHLKKPEVCASASMRERECACVLVCMYTLWPYPFTLPSDPPLPSGYA